MPWQIRGNRGNATNALLRKDAGISARVLVNKVPSLAYVSKTARTTLNAHCDKHSGP